MSQLKYQFKGWNEKNKKWLYGSLLRRDEGCYIVPKNDIIKTTDDNVVSIHSVGQFVTTANGYNIYSGDEIEFISTSPDPTSPDKEIEKNERCFVEYSKDEGTIYPFANEYDCETCKNFYNIVHSSIVIVGNKYDSTIKKIMNKINKGDNE